MKLVINLHLGLIGECFSEVIVMSENLGFKKDTFVNVFNKMPHRNFFSIGEGPKIVHDDYELAFSLNNLVKDLGLVEEQTMKWALSHSQVATDEFRKAAADGLGERDFSVIALSLEKKNGIESQISHWE
jgi:3-hydroxyisobutyrate dehydrogenase-like beta-hydroxyacid dehydrogenase